MMMLTFSGDTLPEPPPRFEVFRVSDGQLSAAAAVGFAGAGQDAGGGVRARILILQQARFGQVVDRQGLPGLGAALETVCGIKQQRAGFRGVGLRAGGG